MDDRNNKMILAKNIRHYMEQNNKTRNEMCEALGVKYTTFADWINGKTYPRIDRIQQIATYFGVENDISVACCGSSISAYQIQQNHELACEYFENIIRIRICDKDYVESIDVDVTDWSGEEEFPIDAHIYCRGVTR